MDFQIQPHQNIENPDIHTNWFYGPGPYWWGYGPWFRPWFHFFGPFRWWW